MFRIFYYTTLLVFMLAAMIFWMYTDEFFSWINAAGYTISPKESFVWGVVLISTVCLVLSIFVIGKQMKEKLVAYLSLIMSAITIVIFIISFFGHGVMPIRGIL